MVIMSEVARGTLTRNQDAVLSCLREAGGQPLGAYAVLDRLRERGLVHPQTVYRALDHLVGAGLVHRVESLNAYVACLHAPHKAAAVFALCRRCGDVLELPMGEAARALERAVTTAGFRVEGAAIEFLGSCGSCDAGGARQPARTASKSRIHGPRPAGEPVETIPTHFHHRANARTAR